MLFLHKTHQLAPQNIRVAARILFFWSFVETDSTYPLKSTLLITSGASIVYYNRDTITKYFWGTTFAGTQIPIGTFYEYLIGKYCFQFEFK